MKKFKIVALILILLLIGFVAFLKLQPPSAHNPLSQFPQCPANLAGILTAPLMPLKYISYLTPLGNINPPGHTSPADHIYFGTDETGPIPLYAPADAWITNITEVSFKNEKGEYDSPEYVLTYEICRGLVLDFAGYTKLNDKLTVTLAGLRSKDCKSDISKPGHSTVERQCYFELNYQVKSGELMGYTQKITQSLPFEIWAANYNKAPRRDVNWDTYYKDDRYAHSMCLFDLYSGDLKSQFYAKFGFKDENKVIKDPQGNIVHFDIKFTPRTAEPICGQVNQDIVGTIQGMWFGSKATKDQSVEFMGLGLAFLHNNIDPRQGEISIGGQITKNAQIVLFNPTKSGVIDREPSEVKADGKIYCYNNQDKSLKVLVQLIDNNHLKAESQTGQCNDNEIFQKSFNYER